MQLIIIYLLIRWRTSNRMATPTHETIETCCNEKSSSWFVHISVTIRFTNCLHDFLDFLFLTFVLCFLFGLGSCAPCSSSTILLFFMVTPRFFRSGIINTDTIILLDLWSSFNVSSQKPCILHTYFTQAYWILDTLSSTILTHGNIHVFSMLSLGRILISDRVVVNLFMHSFPGMILLYLAVPFLHRRFFLHEIPIYTYMLCLKPLPNGKPPVSSTLVHGHHWLSDKQW